MNYTVIANNGSKKVKENLDNMEEVNEFLAKMNRRGFLSASMEAFKETGESKTFELISDGTLWEKI